VIGQILLSSRHLGTVFSPPGASYALLNGQSLNRSTYGSLSAYWPTGAYGSTVTTIVLPDLTDGYYLRGHSFGNGFDPGASSRTVPSGTLPVAPSGIGTFQLAQMVTHTHPSGTQSATLPFGDGGGDANATYPVLGTATSAAPSTLAGLTVVGTASQTSFDLAHMKFYPYIRIL
jgi:hypothetical protein